MLTIALAAGALVVNAERVSAAAPQGAFVDTVIFSEQPSAAVALEQVSRGVDMQMYMFNLRNLADKLAALRDPNIWTVQTPGSVNDLWVNPVPYASGVNMPGTCTGPGFNPFQIQAVRQGLNFLVDRNFIVNQIYGGFAIPYISPWHAKMPEYRREATFFRALDQSFSYDQTRAANQISTALTAVPGMSLDSTGHWVYQSCPLTVRFTIRTEDIRLDIGNYVASLLEAIGFTVIRDYSVAAAAFDRVYFGPPDQAAWNLYTEGFAFTSLQAWQDDWIAGFYTAYSGETVWDFYTPPAPLVENATKLLNSNYASLAERQTMVKDASTLAVEDGVRVWMVAENAVFIYNKRITAAVNDLMAGPWGSFTTRSARYGTPGGTLSIGQPVHWNSQWNTYRGFTWLYDATQQRALTDLGVDLHPTTGLPVAVRATADVTTAGPTGTLAVPSDAKVYNTTSAQFENVPAAATATSKILYNYTFAPWHDGSTMNMEDIWYTIANYYRREGGTDRATDPYTGAQFPVGDIGRIDPRADSPAVNRWLGLFKGAKQVGPNSMEIYADYWQVDSSMIGFTMDFFPAQPWHVHEVQVQTVLDNATRMDASSAQSAQKPVVDLIRGPTIPLMNDALAALKAANHLPPGAASMGITTSSASARYTALDAFRTAHNHYYVSNGPYYLDQVNVPVKQTVMKRYAAYPFPADHWDSFIAPALPSVTIGSVADVVPGIATNIAVNTAVGGTATSNLNVSYLVRNVGLDETVLTGAPTATGTAGVWSINLDANTTGRLVPGGHEITVTALAGELGIPVGTARAFIVIPLTVYLGKLIQDQNAVISGMQQDLTTSKDQLAAANAQISTLTTLLTVSIIVAVVAVVIGLVGIAMIRRGPRSPGTREPPTEKSGEEL